MPRKLKTFTTSLGFFELAVAAPSMKAALEAWGSKSNLFHQGLAKEAEDPAIIAATMAKPGVVLRRAVGSNDTFNQNATLPRVLGIGAVKQTTTRVRSTVEGSQSRKRDDSTCVRERRKAARARASEGSGQAGKTT